VPPETLLFPAIAGVRSKAPSGRPEKGSIKKSCFLRATVSTFRKLKKQIEPRVRLFIEFVVFLAYKQA
jgi:hypothetical protein